MNNSSLQQSQQNNQQFLDPEAQKSEHRKNIVIRIIGMLLLIWSLIGLASIIIALISPISIIIIADLYFLVSTILLFVTSVILLISSIGLISCKRWAVIYYLVSVILIVISFIINLIDPNKVAGGVLGDGIEAIVLIGMFVYVYAKRQDLI